VFFWQIFAKFTILVAQFNNELLLGICNGLAFFRVQICHILAEYSILVVAHWSNGSLLGIYNRFALSFVHLCNY